jgi:hypothetical protein
MPTALYELNLRRRSLSRDVAIAMYTAVAHHFMHSTASGKGGLLLSKHG